MGPTTENCSKRMFFTNKPKSSSYIGFFIFWLTVILSTYSVLNIVCDPAQMSTRSELSVLYPYHETCESFVMPYWYDFRQKCNLVIEEGYPVISRWSAQSQTMLASLREATVRYFEETMRKAVEKAPVGENPETPIFSDDYEKTKDLTDLVPVAASPTIGDNPVRVTPDMIPITSKTPHVEVAGPSLTSAEMQLEPTEDFVYSEEVTSIENMQRVPTDAVEAFLEDEDATVATQVSIDLDTGSVSAQHDREIVTLAEVEPMTVPTIIYQPISVNVPATSNLAMSSRSIIKASNLSIHSTAQSIELQEESSTTLLKSALHIRAPAIAASPTAILNDIIYDVLQSEVTIDNNEPISSTTVEIISASSSANSEETSHTIRTTSDHSDLNQLALIVDFPLDSSQNYDEAIEDNVNIEENTVSEAMAAELMAEYDSDVVLITTTIAVKPSVSLATSAAEASMSITTMLANPSSFLTTMATKLPSSSPPISETVLSAKAIKPSIFPVKLEPVTSVSDIVKIGTAKIASSTTKTAIEAPISSLYLSTAEIIATTSNVIISKTKPAIIDLTATSPGTAESVDSIIDEAESTISLKPVDNVSSATTMSTSIGIAMKTSSYVEVQPVSAVAAAATNNLHTNPTSSRKFRKMIPGSVSRFKKVMDKVPIDPEDFLEVEMQLLELDRDEL